MSGTPIDIIKAAVSESDINWPFFTYPGTPMHGYQEYVTYRKLIKKCHKMIIDLAYSVNKEFLFHLSIGAANEELQIHLPDSSFDFQYQQLSPHHITSYLDKGGSVVHFIISPNRSFDIVRDDGSSSFVEPFFIQFSKHQFDWNLPVFNDGVISYTSKKYDYTVHIFCTMMPCIDAKNILIVEKISSMGEFMKEKVMPFLQTEFDKSFVSHFYSDLHKLINKIISYGGFCVCFSFAVFNEATDHSRYKNYAMFPEIMNIFAANLRSAILAEWTFRRGIYLMKHFNGYDCDGKIIISDKYISYVNPDHTCADGYQIVISQNKYSLIPSEYFVKSKSNSSESCSSVSNIKYLSIEIIERYYKLFQQYNVKKSTNNQSTNSTKSSIKCADMYQLSYDEIKKTCLNIIKRFPPNIVLKYITELNILEYMEKSSNDDELLDIYFKLISGEKNDINKNIIGLELLGLFALSIIFNCTVKYKGISIVHPNVKITNRSFIDVTKFDFI